MSLGRRTSPFLRAVAALAAAAAMAVVAACSSSSGQGGEPQVDSGAADSSTCTGERCAQLDAAADVPPFDTGWVCPDIPETNVGSDCDTCVQTHCDAMWCTCAQQQVVVDAGPIGCLAFLACTMSCPADGGASAACSDAGCAATSSQADQQNAQALLSCIAQSCATACAGLTTLEI
jgi:hypothetical protein